MLFEVHKKKLNQVFLEFRRIGFAAKYVPQKSWKFLETADDVITYQKADLDILKERGYIYLTWAGNVQKILEVLRNNFEHVLWDGMVGSKIKVKF